MSASQPELPLDYNEEDGRKPRSRCHELHRMHGNSIESYLDGLIELESRMAMIVRLYVAREAPMTDREVKEILSFDDMNDVRPAITTLLQDSFIGANDAPLVETGSATCPRTGRQVRMCEHKK